jgi:hypothetical protein
LVGWLVGYLAVVRLRGPRRALYRAALAELLLLLLLLCTFFKGS